MHLELEVSGDSFAFSPDSKTIAYCDLWNKIALVDINNLETVIRINLQPEPVVSVIFDKDTDFLYPLYHLLYLNELKIWNTSTRELIDNLKNHSANVTFLALNSKAEIVSVLGTGEPNKTINLGHEIRTLKGYSTTIKTEASSPDGIFMARSYSDLLDRVELLSNNTNKLTLQVYCPTGYSSKPIQSLAFSHDSKLLATGDANKTEIYKIPQTKAIYRHYPPFIRFTPSIAFTHINSEKNPVLVTSHFLSSFEQGIATLSEKKDIELKWNSKRKVDNPGHTVFSGDKKVIARKHNYQPIQIWNLATGKDLVFIAETEHDYLFCLNYSGNNIVVCSYKESSCNLKLFDVKTSKFIKTIVEHTDSIKAIQFSPDDRMLAFGSNDTTTKVWNLETEQEIITFHGYSSIKALAFNPVKPLLAAGNTDGNVFIYDLETLEEIHRFSATKGSNDRVKVLEFSPDGKFLASKTGAGDSKLRLWSLE